MDMMDRSSKTLLGDILIIQTVITVIGLASLLGLWYPLFDLPIPELGPGWDDPAVSLANLLMLAGLTWVYRVVYRDSVLNQLIDADMATAPKPAKGRGIR